MMSTIWFEESYGLQLLSTGAVYPYTLRIPFPYTEADAEWFINLTAANFVEKGFHSHFAIRDTENDDVLMGVAGIFDIDETKTVEIGYWIGEEDWGQGLMEHCIRALTKIG
jgi:ribosomal-protein-alanine N-acetyltransferase